jgi:citrate lyase subunit beta / citryl-CoA lyase
VPAAQHDRYGAVQAARSFLFVPGHRPDRFEKAERSGADMVVLDLEDAVAADRKDDARDEVVTWLTAGGRACVRINDATSPQHPNDLAALTGLPGLIAVMLAKADHSAQVADVARRTGAPVIALVESAVGMAKVGDLAAVRGVVRLAFGHLDFALDIGAEPIWPSMLHARSVLVLASRAAGLPGPLDGVTTDMDDLDVLRADVRRAKSVGMSGKLLIHPRQVAPTHAELRPSDDEIRWAQHVLESTAGTAAARVDGQMVDAPVLARAGAILGRIRGAPPHAG